MLFIATLLARPFQPRNGAAKAGIFYLLFTGLLFACSGNAAGAYPIPIEDKTVRFGSGIYTANCQSCHGNGTTPPPLPQAPPHTVVGHTWHHPDQLLVEWILDGVPLAETMPTFRGHLFEDEVRATIAFIKTTWPAEVRHMHAKGTKQFAAQQAR